MRKGGQAEGGGDPHKDFFLLQKRGGDDGLFHPLHFGQRLLFILAGQDDDVLIAAVTDQAILLVEHAMDGLGHFAQYFRPQDVPVGIDHVFEVI